VLDLAATYIMLNNVRKEDTNSIIQRFIKYLDNGYTYNELRGAILDAFHSKQLFPDYRYEKPCKQEGNLLKQGIMYYHKQLKLMNSLPTINHDIDKGTMTSEKVEYYLEQVASYTINDLLTYFYSKNMADVQEYNPKRMAGIFRHMIDKYGLDKLLFMIEGAARMYESEHKIFSLSDFDSYSLTASQYLEEIKNNCKYSGGDKYVARKRVLFG
jgi:hypothetical protein